MIHSEIEPRILNTLEEVINIVDKVLPEFNSLPIPRGQAISQCIPISPHIREAVDLWLITSITIPVYKSNGQRTFEVVNKETRKVQYYVFYLIRISV